jgi:hypothetical protein
MSHRPNGKTRSVSKFADRVAELVYLLSLDGGADEEVGSSTEAPGTWAGLMRGGAQMAQALEASPSEYDLDAEDATDLTEIRRSAGIILFEETSGSVSADVYEDGEALEEAWAAVARDLEPEAADDDERSYGPSHEPNGDVIPFEPRNPSRNPPRSDRQPFRSNELVVLEKRLKPSGKLDFSDPQPPFDPMTFDQLYELFFRQTKFSGRSASWNDLRAWLESMRFVVRASPVTMRRNAEHRMPTAAEWFKRYPDLGRTPLFTLRFKVGNVNQTENVTIRAYEGPVQQPYGHTTIFCELRAPGVIFSRDEFYIGVPRGEVLDSKYSKAMVMSLFAMKPGDTDDEFFEHYSPEQLEFVEEHGEEISLISAERYGEF